MLTYWLKCKKDTENLNSKELETKKMVEQCYNQNVLYAVAKN